VNPGSGLELAGAFYAEAVRPIVERACPGLVYSAARIGRGSEVLGFDDQVSRDHDWGPRLELFVDGPDFDRYEKRLVGIVAEELPRTFRGYSTSFGLEADGVGVLIEADPLAPVAHRVEINELGRWCDSMLGFDPRRGIGWFDWLATSSHRLAEVTGGAVFHDGLGALSSIRASLAYYPHEVWLFVLASQWKRISQEEAFVGRCAQVGDDLGSSLIAGRLVRDVMRLCLMMDRRYIPYAKWLGTAFARLNIAASLRPHLAGAVHETDSGRRQDHLANAYQLIVERHNGLEITAPIDPTVGSFWKRGFPVILADRLAVAIRQEMKEPDLLQLPLAGSVDQFLDSTDVLAPAHLARAAAGAVLVGS
jgi:hypothetical protein